MRLHRLMFSALCCFALASLAAACSFDTSPGSSFAGQVCFQDADCASGLTCVDRRCRPISGEQPADAGDDGDTGVDSEADAQSDTTGECEDGQRRCQSERILEVCEAGSWVQSTCGDQEVCSEGTCIDVSACQDEDGDGYPGGGPECPDCDDTDPDINPGAEEVCGNGVDDDCNGAVDDGCQTECCPDGCGDDEVCSVCECRPYEPEECTVTGQPCSIPGQASNGFFCSDDFFDEPRCVGLCNSDAEDPNSTCPQEGTVCSFGQDNGQGICLEGCFLDRGCSTPGFGCLPVDGNDTDGICVPSDDNNQVGDPCDPDDTFGCEAGSFCLDLGQGQATCQEACRPFEFDDGSNTDCDSGHCFPFSSTFGFCQEDATVEEDGSCTPSDAFFTCEQDATVCAGGGQFGGGRCFDMCRTDLGNQDCAMGAQCRESQDLDGVGFCARGGGF
ncbi:MAG: MopE-related protein [Myxococcota bacterium]